MNPHHCICTWDTLSRGLVVKALYECRRGVFNCCKVWFDGWSTLRLRKFSVFRWVILPARPAQSVSKIRLIEAPDVQCASIGVFASDSRLCEHVHWDELAYQHIVQKDCQGV